MQVWRLKVMGLVGALLALAPTGARAAEPGAASQPPDKPRLAIADFSITGDVGIAQAGKAVSELLVTEVSQARYRVMERSQLEALLKEHQVTMAELAAEPGKLKGKPFSNVRYLLVGSVVKLGTLSVSARVVDMQTGEVTAKARVSAEDARGLQNALTALARELGISDGAVPAPSSEALTLVFSANDHGIVRRPGQEPAWSGYLPARLTGLRSGPLALEFIPDVEVKTGARVCLVQKWQDLPASTVGTVTGEYDRKAEGYPVRWDGQTQSVLVNRSAFSTLEKGSPVALRVDLTGKQGVVNATYLAKPVVEKGLAAEASALPTPALRKQSSLVTAAMDATRRAMERATLGARTVKLAKGAFSSELSARQRGLRVGTYCVINDFVTFVDRVRLTLDDSPAVSLDSREFVYAGERLDESLATIEGLKTRLGRHGVELVSHSFHDNEPIAEAVVRLPAGEVIFWGGNEDQVPRVPLPRLGETWLLHDKTCFVVDCSGSMLDAWVPAVKLLERSIDALLSEQEFGVLLWSKDQPRELNAALLKANDVNKSKAKAFLNSVRPRGTTDPLPALQRAVTLLKAAGASSAGICLVTDGPLAEVKKAIELLTRLDPKKEIVVHTFLLGTGSAQGRRDLERLAETFGGSFTQLKVE